MLFVRSSNEIDIRNLIKFPRWFSAKEYLNNRSTSPLRNSFSLGILLISLVGCGGKKEEAPKATGSSQCIYSNITAGYFAYWAAGIRRIIGFPRSSEKEEKVARAKFEGLDGFRLLDEYPNNMEQSEPPKFKPRETGYTFHQYSFGTPADSAEIKSQCQNSLSPAELEIGNRNLVSVAPLSSVQLPRMPNAEKDSGYHVLAVWACYVPCDWRK